MTPPERDVLLDASALIAFLGGEPAATEVGELLESGRAMLTTLNLAEAIDRLARRYGIGQDRSRPLVEGLLDQALVLIELPAERAWLAAKIRSSHYHRSECPLSMADSVLPASAHGRYELATSDSACAGVAHALGVSVIALPNSSGVRPVGA